MDSFLAGAEPEVEEEEEEADTKLELRVPAFLKLVNCPATFDQLMRSEKGPISVFYSYRLFQDTFVDHYSRGKSFVNNANVVLLQSLNHVPGCHQLGLLVHLPIPKGLNASLINTPEH